MKDHPQRSPLSVPNPADPVLYNSSIRATFPDDRSKLIRKDQSLASTQGQRFNSSLLPRSLFTDQELAARKYGLLINR